MRLIFDVHGGLGSQARFSKSSYSTSYNYATVHTDSGRRSASPSESANSSPSPGPSSSFSNQILSKSQPRCVRTTKRRPRTPFEEFKRRARLFLKNGAESRARYADFQYRLSVREEVVTLALRLLRENSTRNFSIIAQSQLFSAIIFDQLLPGTVPVVHIDKLPSPSAYTLKPNAYILQQRIDMLRVVFGQHLIRAPQTFDLREMQAVVYDSSRFPLFTTPTETAQSRSGAGSMYRAVGPQRLPDSAWSDIDASCTTSVVPRFDVLISIINFFVHHSERTATVREGLLPFFNTPPEAADFTFTDGDTFDFPKDWTGLYGYLAFWDFDVLRRTSGARTENKNTTAVPDPRFKPATASLPGYAPLPGSSSSSPAMPDPATVPSVEALPFSSPSPTQITGYHGASHPSVSQTPSATGPSSHPSYPSQKPERPSSSAKIVDQFDGMQIMQVDLPPIHGPVSFVGRGRDRYDYITYSTLIPLDACYGLPGFARFGMRKEYILTDSDGGSDDGEGVVWEYNGVYIPGPKIMLGRWRDGSDPSVSNAVEGPFMFFAEL